MFDLTNRQVGELEWLCRQDEPVLVGDVAYRFHVSVRSVRNDLYQLEQFARRHNVILERKRGKGIALVGTPSSVKALRRTLETLGRRILNPEERLSVMIASLLLRDSATFQLLADDCGVSRQTAIRDFPEVEATLKNECISVVRCQGKGLTLQANELSIRHAFVQLLADNPCPDCISDVVARDKGMSLCMPLAKEILHHAKVVLGMGFLNEGYIETLVCYMLRRIQCGHAVQSTHYELELSANAETLDLLRTMLERYVSQRDERTYLATLILSQRIGPLPSQGERTEADAMNGEAEKLSRQLVGALSKYQRIDGVAVKDVVSMLTEHIRAALYRKHNNIQLHDEKIESYLRLTSPLILEFTSSALEDCGVAFPPSEIAYIAMYLTSIFEASGGEDLVPSVLFVCSFGLATSVLLKSRLERLLFGCRLVGPKSLGEAKEYLQRNEVDLVIASCEFSTSAAPVLYVNPMLTQVDIDRVKGYVNQLPYTKMSSQFVKHYTEQRHEKTFHRVTDYVCADDIQVVDACESWQDAIRLAAMPLVQRGLMEPRYVETMIHAVCELGTYMVLTPGTAYVHAGVDDGISGDCAAILVSRSPIRFGSENAKNVRAIVVLGIKHQDKSDLLTLASIFGASSNLESLAKPDISAKTIAHMHD
jgi:transcriptional antiterminator/mannitol/fructose-specific phosphotransferase system IIA component (Ntr-type)